MNADVRNFQTLQKEVTLSLDTSAYADGDVLAATQEVALVATAPIRGVRGAVVGVRLIDQDDQGQGLDLLLLKSNVSIGTENSAVSVSDANALEIVGRIPVASTDWYDLGGCRIANPEILPRKFHVAGGSLYLAAVSRGTGTYSAAGIKVMLHVELENVVI